MSKNTVVLSVFEENNLLKFCNSKKKIDVKQKISFFQKLNRYFIWSLYVVCAINNILRPTFYISVCARVQYYNARTYRHVKYEAWNYYIDTFLSRSLCTKIAYAHKNSSTIKNYFNVGSMNCTFSNVVFNKVQLIIYNLRLIRKGAIHGTIVFEITLKISKISKKVKFECWLI